TGRVLDDEPVPDGVPQGELIDVEGHRGQGAVTRGHAHPGKPTQGTQRGAETGSQLAGVDLDDLLRGAGTGVGDQNLHDDASVGHAHERFGVTHRCVPQAVTERVERIALEVQVGAARGDDVVVQRVGQVRNGAV